MKKMKKGVLVYGLSNTWGGMEAIVLNMAKTLLQYLEIDILLPLGECSYEKLHSYNGVNFIHTPAWGSNRGLFCSNLRTLIDKKKYDYIWLNSCILANRDILVIASEFPFLKIITHAHSSSFEENNILKRLILYGLHYYNRPLYIKETTYPCMCSLQAGKWLFGEQFFEKNKVLQVNNGIDISKYRFSPQLREKIRFELGIADEIAIFNVGRLVKVKNQFRLIDIVQQIAASGSNIKLFIAGEGELKTELIEYTRKKTMESIITFLGHRDDIGTLCQAMDVFVLPSFNEGFGMVLVEAQASGLPCVASSTVPIETNVTGLVNYLSLDESNEKWANTIIESAKIRIDRDKMADVIANSGFDIVQSSNEFLDYINAFEK